MFTQQEKVLNSKDNLTENNSVKGLTLRAILISVAFTLIFMVFFTIGNAAAAYWLIDAGMYGAGMHGYIAIILLSLFINPLLTAFKKGGITKAEKIIVWVFVTTSGILFYTAWYMIYTVAAPNWQIGSDPFSWTYTIRTGVWDNLPSYLFIKTDDMSAMAPFWFGERASVPWGLWITPLIMWGLFSLALAICYFMLGVIVRRRWSDRERLRYPYATISFALCDDFKTTTPNKSMWKNKFLWIGAFIAFIFRMGMAVSRWWPIIPEYSTAFANTWLLNILSGHALQAFFVNGTIVQWYFTYFGIGYFVDLSILFSVWFFYLLYRFVNYYTIISGSPAHGPLHNVIPVEVGTKLGFGIFLVFLMRRDLIDIMKKAFRGKAYALDDSNEPVSYRMAVFAFLGSFLFMLLFLHFLLGLSIIRQGVLWIIGFIVVIIYTRCRAEAGVGGNHGTMRPWLSEFWIPMAGVSSMTPNQMVLNPIIHYISHINPQSGNTATLLEGCYMADQEGIHRRDIMKTMLGALVLTIFVIPFIQLYMKYNYLPPALLDRGALVTRYMSFAETWLSGAHRPAGFYNMWFVGGGFILVILCYYLYVRFPWIPFHPLGIVLSIDSWISKIFFLPFMVMWFIKLIILRYGGGGLYRKLTPVAYGFIVGDSMGVLLIAIIALITGDIRATAL
jgi:hypothetical protein